MQEKNQFYAYKKLLMQFLKMGSIIFTPTPYVGWVIIAINKDIPIYIYF